MSFLCRKAVYSMDEASGGNGAESEVQVRPSCDGCAFWLRGTKLEYSEGYTSDLPQDPPKCQRLSIATPPDFYCKDFSFGPEKQIQVICRTGAPWTNWVMGPCPDCKGAGSSGAACHRCAGTGNVRYYDDGFVGEEQTRRHPKEPVRVASPDPGLILQPVVNEWRP